MAPSGAEAAERVVRRTVIGRGLIPGKVEDVAQAMPPGAAVLSKSSRLTFDHFAHQPVSPVDVAVRSDYGLASRSISARCCSTASRKRCR